jgi:hypothetical protein
MTQGNLSDVFGAPAAGSGLAGRLPRVAPAQPAAAPVAAPVAVPPAIPVAAPVAGQPAAAPASADADTSTRQITVYVLPHVPDRIRAGKHGRTNAAVVYDAIEAAQQQIPALLAARRAAPQPASGALFARHTGDQRDGGRVPWTFKTTPANRRVLDQLVDAHGAVSRSELVSTVLEHAYPPATD